MNERVANFENTKEKAETKCDEINYNISTK